MANFTILVQVQTTEQTVFHFLILGISRFPPKKFYIIDYSLIILVWAIFNQPKVGYFLKLLIIAAFFHDTRAKNVQKLVFCTFLACGCFCRNFCYGDFYYNAFVFENNLTDNFLNLLSLKKQMEPMLHETIYYLVLVILIWQKYILGPTFQVSRKQILFLSPF